MAIMPVERAATIKLGDPNDPATAVGPVVAERQRDKIVGMLESGKQQGAKVAFDGNFRPHGWKGNLPRARTVYMEALKRADVALPTFDDEAVLWGDPSPEATVERLQAFGIGEIAVPSTSVMARCARSTHP